VRALRPARCTSFPDVDEIALALAMLHGRGMKRLSIHELAAIVGGQQWNPRNDPNWQISRRDAGICQMYATPDKKDQCNLAAENDLYAVPGAHVPSSVIKAGAALGIAPLAKGK
jgi:bacteriocin-like protein